jgi:hypothetical protein
MPIKRSYRWHVPARPGILVLVVLALAGCATNYPSFSEHQRQTIGEQDLQSLAFTISTPITFKSLRVLDPVPEKDKHLFSPSGYRFVDLAETTVGRLVGQGQDWLAVDFGRGIVLTFSRRSSDGVYATAGWGTYTIEGERYDIVVGIKSGVDIELCVKPSPIR